MDVITFVSELLNGLSLLETVQGVTSQAEGPTVRGRAHFGGDLFLAFYYNQMTGTQAFALVRNEQRLWGIDYDNLRGWHEHPLGQPELHVILEAQTMSSIIQRLKDAVPGAVSAE
ncbi:MAG: hypothetical protein ACYC6R_17670 [Anaerolineales bacterium]